MSPDEFAKYPAAQLIRDRIQRRAGISIDRFVGQITDSYFHRNCPDGFKFLPQHGDLFIKLLRESPQFAIATGFDMRPHAVVFREVSRPDSLHIRVDRFGGSSEMHLDKVSIVDGRDNAGQVIYAEDVSLGVEHLVTDLIHRQR